MELSIAQEMIRTVESARGPVVRLPTMGATVPLEAFERPLGTTTIIVPIANHDDNQHTFNENVPLNYVVDERGRTHAIYRAKDMMFLPEGDHPGARGHHLLGGLLAELEDPLQQPGVLPPQAPPLLALFDQHPDLVR